MAATHKILGISATLMLVAGTASAQSGRYVGGQGLRTPGIAPGTTTGKMDTNPYSSSYLPRKEGPLARENDAEIGRMIKDGFGECNLIHEAIQKNAELATSKKYDKAIKKVEGRDPKLTADYNKNGYNKDAESWEGFCHLWAPAGIDPASAFIVSMDKIYADVPFGIGDLRELVTYNYPRAYSRFIGKRHYDKDSSEKPEDELDPVDVLTVVETYVGPGKAGVVFDVDPGYMVWNQAIDSYEKTVTEATGETLPAGATKAYKVQLDMKYVVEGNYAYRGDTLTRDLNLGMTVFTDDSGNIVDSKWAPGTRVPDFAWAPEVKNTNAAMERLKRIQKDGIAVKDIEAFCKGMDALTADGIQNGDAEKLAKLLDAICPVLDQNKLREYIRKTAERTGIDYSVLDDALASTTAAHS